MNPDGLTGPIAIYLKTANPLLYTLPQSQMNIRPYWMMVVQLIASQQVDRVANFVTNGTFFTPFETGITCSIPPIIEWIIDKGPKRLTTFFYMKKVVDPRPRSYPRIVAYFFPSFNEITPPVKNICDASKQLNINELKYMIVRKMREKCYKELQFGIGDCKHTIPLLAHAIWYCSIQSPCMSAEGGTAWNCYNAFGYTLYNYIFSSYFEFCADFLMKFAYRKEVNKAMAIENIHKKKSILKKLPYWLGYYSSLITFVFVGCLLLPFFLTNIIPMAGAYAFIHIIYWGCMIVILHYGGYFLHLQRILKWRIKFASIIISAALLYTFPELISLTYNYSQYLYYGNDYIKTTTDEYNTRDTATYIKLLRNSANSAFHTIFDFF